jgi:hypothetical protein
MLTFKATLLFEQSFAELESTRGPNAELFVVVVIWLFNMSHKDGIWIEPCPIEIDELSWSAEAFATLMLRDGVLISKELPTGKWLANTVATVS